MRAVRIVDTSMHCPVCGAALAIRSSRQVTELLREEFCYCSSDTCPHRYKVTREIVASLYEGSYEAGLKIPQSLRRQALSPAPARPDPNQLAFPGLEPPDLSCYGGAPP